MSSESRITIEPGTIEPGTIEPGTIEPGLTGEVALLPNPEVGAACQHDVQFYFDDRFLIRSVSSFVRAELEAGSSAVVVATRSHRESLAEELGRCGVNLSP